MTITDFEHIVTTYTNSTLETMFASKNKLFVIPEYVTEDASLIFDLNGYIINIKKFFFFFLFLFLFSIQNISFHTIYKYIIYKHIYKYIYIYIMNFD